MAFVEDVNELPTVVPGHRRSASLEVETGSFSAPESAKLDQDMSSEDATSEIPLDGPDPAAATDEQALAPSNKSVASEEGTVITHSTPDSTASTTRKVRAILASFKKIALAAVCCKQCSTRV